MGKAVKHQVAPLVRGAFIGALGIVGDRRGQTLPEMLASEIEQEGLLEVMRVIARFVEKESSIAVAVEQTTLVDVLKGIGERSRDLPH